MKRRVVRCSLLTVLLALMLCAGVSSAYAETETGAATPTWTVMEESDTTLNSYLTEYALAVNNIGNYDENSFTITSSDEDVVVVDGVEYYSEEGAVLWILRKTGVGSAVITITDPAGLSRTCDITAKNKGADIEVVPKKAGKTVLTVTDNYGRTKNVTVTVAKNYFKNNLKEHTWANLYYGRSKAEVYSKPKARVTVKIAGKKYTKKTNKNGKAVIYLAKSDYKLNTKVTITARYKGMTITKKDQVSSHTWTSFGQIWSCERDVPVTVYNVTKGDKVILEAGGKKYRKNITSKADSISLVFYTKYDLGNYRTLKLTVKNKYGQKLTERTWNITWN